MTEHENDHENDHENENDQETPAAPNSPSEQAKVREREMEESGEENAA